MLPVAVKAHRLAAQALTFTFSGTSSFSARGSSFSVTCREGVRTKLDDLLLLMS